MGKKKQAQRTKNNVVPASSGRSAELLQSTSGVPFVGFSTLKEGGFIPIFSGTNEELDVNINEDFRLVWKKMNKKDTTTKLKALDEFKKLCSESDVEALKPVLPYWPRLFCTLSTDEEHRVREGAHAAHRALVSKAGRNIAPYLKQLVGPWFTGQHDTYPPAASTAESAFQETFPPNKLIEAIVFCQDEILNYICNNLLNETAQSLANNQNCSEEVKQARYQRVVVSCLNGYALYLQRLPVEHLHKAEEGNRKLVCSAKFWRFNKDPAHLVRAAWFTALVALCEKAPFLLFNQSKHVCMAVFTNIDETEPSVVQAVWQAALLTFNVVDDVWKYVSLEKLVLPKLWKILREGADGNASLVFPNLLPLLSKIPSSLLPDKAQFYSKFFANLRTGLKVRNVQISAKETSAVITTFLECVRYLISVNTSDDQLCFTLFKEQVFPLLEAVISDPVLHLARTCLFCGLASLINSWSRQAPVHQPLIDTYWERLAAICCQALEQHVTDASALTAHCAALTALISALKYPESQHRKGFKVKFVSPRKSECEEEERSPTEQCPLCPAFEQERSKFIQGQLRLCFTLSKSCGDQAKVVLVRHIARIVEEYDSKQIFDHMLEITQQPWSGLYQQVLAYYLSDENIPLDCSLRIIFTLLKYVNDDSQVKMVYNHLSGEKLQTASAEENDFQPGKLCVNWEAVLAWALRLEHQTECVRQWLTADSQNVCRLLAIVTQHHDSYNVLHNCLRNLRQHSWLSTSCLSEVVVTLRHNLSDTDVPSEVKSCSANLLQAMLQNVANHLVLTRLWIGDLAELLYDMLTGSLHKQLHYPQCWQQCIAVLALKADPALPINEICENCVDLLVSAVWSRPMDLAESKQLITVLEDVVRATRREAEDQVVGLMGVVLNHLTDRVGEDSQLIWSLYTAVETVAGSLRGIPLPLPLYQLCSNTEKDPLAAVPLQQYVTSSIPVLMMVVRLWTDTDTDIQSLYSQLRTAVSQDDLERWTAHVLQLHSICISLKKHLESTKPFFLLQKKISFIVEECVRLGKVGVTNLINLSQWEAYGSMSRACKHAVLKDLCQLCDIQVLATDLQAFKSNTLIAKFYFPCQVLDEITASKALSEPLQLDELALVNTCHWSQATIYNSNYETITIQDRVIYQHVDRLTYNRSLLHLSDEELLLVAEVADFTTHTVVYNSALLELTSWDSCLIAAAMLMECVMNTLLDRKGYPNYPSPPMPCLSLAMVKMMCATFRLFDAVSTYMDNIDVDDKAANARFEEWTDLFLTSAQCALTRSWLVIAEMPCDRPDMVLLVRAVSNSVARFTTYPHCDISKDELSSLDMCCRLLQSSESSVQLAAYIQLRKLIPSMVDLDMKQCEKDNVALSCQKFDQTLVYTQSIIDTILSGFSFGDTCIVEPFTDSYTYTRCYLLLWCALLELCTHACSQLRALYTTWLKEEYLPMFMKTVFCLMPEVVLHGEVTSPRITLLFSKAPDLSTGLWDSDRLAQLSCWAYAVTLRRLPAAVRHWWHEVDHKIYSLVEHVTATYVSPDLCADEMRAIQNQEKKFDNMMVHVHASTKEVYAVYTLEEFHMELVIELAHNHPLGQVKVRSGQSMVSTTQTRQWLLQITIFLTHQNGSIWNALELWKTSLDKRFEGVEECYICFAILHSTSRQLPKLSCHTCHKKFHSHCLYKWFTTSNKSTCPICRNLF